LETALTERKEYRWVRDNKKEVEVLGSRMRLEGGIPEACKQGNGSPQHNEKRELHKKGMQSNGHAH